MAGVFQKAETVPVLKATCSKRLPPHYFAPFSPLICSRCLESPITYQHYLAGCRPRTTRTFCFGKRTQNHVRPCAAPPGYLCLSPESYGCATRSAQTVLASTPDSAAILGPTSRGPNQNVFVCISGSPKTTRKRISTPPIRLKPRHIQEGAPTYKAWWFLSRELTV